MTEVETRIISESPRRPGRVQAVVIVRDEKRSQTTTVHCMKAELPEMAAMLRQWFEREGAGHDVAAT